MSANKFSLFTLLAGLAALNLAQADDSSFIDLVRMGSDAESDNRFATDTATAVGGAGSTAGTNTQAANRGGHS